MQRKLSSGGWCSLYAGGLQNIYGENCPRRTDENRECTGLDVYRIEMYGHLNVGQCGGVRIENMKLRIVLQAQSS